MCSHAHRSLVAELHQLQLPSPIPSTNMRTCVRIHQCVRRFGVHSSRTSTVTQPTRQDKGQHSTAVASFSGRNADSDLAGGGSSIAQPSASNAGCDSTNTPAAPTASSSNNGSSPPVQKHGPEQQEPQFSTNEVSQLRNEVSKVSELVANQARMLQGQMKDLEHARGLIDMHAMTNTLSNAAPTQTIKAGWNKDVKPFEVQRNAIGDRRYLGGYDARFHSTNM